MFLILAAFHFFPLTFNFQFNFGQVWFLWTLRYTKILTFVFFIVFGKFEPSILKILSAPVSLSSPSGILIMWIPEPEFILLQSFPFCSSEWIITIDLSSNSLALSSLISNLPLPSSCEFFISLLHLSSSKKVHLISFPDEIPHLRHF